MRHLFWHILGLMYIEYGGEFEQFATAAKIRTVRVHKADSMTLEENHQSENKRGAGKKDMS